MKIFSSSQSGAARTQAALMTQTVFRRYLDVSLSSSRRPTGWPRESAGARCGVPDGQVNLYVLVAWHLGGVKRVP